MGMLFNRDLQLFRQGSYPLIDAHWGVVAESVTVPYAVAASALSCVGELG